MVALIGDAVFFPGISRQTCLAAERTEEIARMLAGEEITPAAKAAARALLAPRG